MACSALHTRALRRSYVTGQQTAAGTTSSEDPAWRCVDLHVTTPSRVLLQWTGHGDTDARLLFDASNSCRVYVHAASLSLSAMGHNAAGVLSWMCSDVPGPAGRQAFYLAEHLDEGSYDSASDAELRPPQWATRLQIDRGTIAGTVDVVLYRGADIVGTWDESTLPESGVPLAGSTRLTVTATGTRVRLTYTLEM